jgi:hypothetical protein
VGIVTYVLLVGAGGGGNVPTSRSPLDQTPETPMARTCRFVLAMALPLLLASLTLANDAESRSLYPCVNVLTFFNKEMKAELKIGLDQERLLKASEARRDKIWKQYCQATDKVQKSTLSAREKNAQLRALETQVVEDLFQVYGEALQPEQLKRMKQIVLQVRGMEIFDYPEIRKSLKIGDKEVRQLNDAWNKLASEMATQLKADVAAKKISQNEAARQAWSMRVGVPERVRQLLSQSQQKVLNDLLGEKYNYKN